MSTPAEMKERHGRVLGELAELGLSLARRLHGHAMATEDEAQAASLGTAFHRVSRGVRQTLALEARLSRELRQDDISMRGEAERDRIVAVHKRRVQVRAAVERTVWDETEDDDSAERLLETLGEILDEEELDEAFTREPAPQQIARLRARLGLTGPAAAPATAPTPAWRSSA